MVVENASTHDHIDNAATNLFNPAFPFLLNFFRFPDKGIESSHDISMVQNETIKPRFIRTPDSTTPKDLLPKKEDA